MTDTRLHPFASFSELLDLGMSRHQVADALSRGELERLARGMYVWSTPASPGPDAANRHHVLETTAHLSRLDDRVVASHHSGALLHGLPVWGADLGLVHLTRLQDIRSRRTPGVRVHQRCEGQVVTRTDDGWPVLGVAECVVGAGMAARDRVPHPMTTLVAADAALHDGRVTRAELDAAVDALTGYRGVAPIREALVHADGRHESPGETRLSGLFRTLRVPVTPQVWVTAEGQDYRVDFMVDEYPVIAEMDGLGKYFLPDRGAEADPRRALKLEKHREDAMRREGYVFVRVTWDELSNPRLLQRRLLVAIEQSKRSPLMG